jgi:hypothetical protein
VSHGISAGLAEVAQDSGKLVVHAALRHDAPFATLLLAHTRQRVQTWREFDEKEATRTPPWRPLHSVTSATSSTTSPSQWAQQEVHWGRCAGAFPRPRFRPPTISLQPLPAQPDPCSRPSAPALTHDGHGEFLSARFRRRRRRAAFSTWTGTRTGKS